MLSKAIAPTYCVTITLIRLGNHNSTENHIYQNAISASQKCSQKICLILYDPDLDPTDEPANTQRRNNADELQQTFGSGPMLASIGPTAIRFLMFDVTSW